MKNIGDMSRSFDLVLPLTPTRTDSGEEVQSYVSTGPVWGEWRTITAREFLQADQSKAVSTHRIRMRYLSLDISGGRLVPRGTDKLLYINGVLPDEKDGRFMWVLCSEDVRNASS